MSPDSLHDRRVPNGTLAVGAIEVLFFSFLNHSPGHGVQWTPEVLNGIYNRIALRACMISFITLNTPTKQSSFRPAMQRGNSDAQRKFSQKCHQVDTSRCTFGFYGSHP